MSRDALRVAFLLTAVALLGVLLQGAGALPVGGIDLAYDFGPRGEAASEGHLRLGLEDTYDRKRGFGFVGSKGDYERGFRLRGPAADSLNSFVFDDGGLSFVHDLPNGKYLVSLASGDRGTAKMVTITINGEEIVAERWVQPGDFLKLRNYEVEVTAGKLTVRLDKLVVLNYLKILSADKAAEKEIVPAADLWEALGLKRNDPFGETARSNKNSTLNMDFLPEGEFSLDEDQWGPIVRVNMFKIRDWENVPGVKKGWRMQGYEREKGMAFHPIMSEVKDVDGDGRPDIFRCRSEHDGAQIERLRYGDGAVVWESEPMGALIGDETRLPVYDLDRDGTYSVLHSTRKGVWCLNAATGRTEWSVDAVGDLAVGSFLDQEKLAVVVRSGGTLRCYDHAGKLRWTHESGLTGPDAYSHEIYQFDADADGRHELYVNWQSRTLALHGGGRTLWEDNTQRHHSDYLVCGDWDGDGRIELVYDHEGCGAEKGPAYIVDALTGKLESKIDYRAAGLRHAQSAALADFDQGRPGLELAICGKRGGIFLWDARGDLVWKRHVPASLLSRGDWDGDGDEEILAFGLGANIDGMFSVWDGSGKRHYAISFLPSPSKRTWSDKHLGGSWSHAMPGGHEGIDRQIDLDGNGRCDVIMPFGAWHWGSDSILFLMESGER